MLVGLWYGFVFFSRMKTLHWANHILFSLGETRHFCHFRRNAAFGQGAKTRSAKNTFLVTPSLESMFVSESWAHQGTDLSLAVLERGKERLRERKKERDIYIYIHMFLYIERDRESDR